MSSLKIKKVKCPKCHDKFDPTVKAVTDGLSHCPLKGCGLEKIDFKLLTDDVNPQDVEEADERSMLYLDYEEPLEIHVYSSTHKTVSE